jgi:predicted ATPase/DNA-binding winged helix-turn-helix (wHTH) protein
MLQGASEECYAFAGFQLYPRQRALTLGAELIAIGSRAFDLLHHLVSHAGTVVSSSALMRSTWPGITVEEANLRVQMSIVRKVLSQCEEAQRAIETVPLQGYCFILPVRHRPNAIEAEGAERPHRNTLPARLNSIIGREDAIKVIGAGLEAHQLVTITGPGGIGKTTTAIAAADQYAEHSQGMVSFVDLSQASDEASAVSTVLEALGLDVTCNPFVALCEYLQNRSVLLILDTCEHIVEAIARLTEDLLSRCSDLKILVTSREALRATEEWTHRLPPLTFPEEGQDVRDENKDDYSAIALFVDRVCSSMRFELQTGDLAVIGEICRRLDGIPLALEFAADRVVDLGLRGVAAHLDDRFKILTRGRRTALPRHRTLSATLDWSHSLLSKYEQRLLRHLVSLGGPFTAERALAGGDGFERSPEALSGLYEKSFLTVNTREGAPIYHLLDTVTAYVALKYSSVADQVA